MALRQAMMAELATLYRRPEDHTYLDVPIICRHHQLLVRRLVDFLGLAPGAKVIELGAGSGRYTRLLLDAGLRVRAYEPEPYLAAKLRDALAGEALDIAPEPLTPASLVADDIDGLIGFHVLHHLDGPALEQLRLTIAALEARERFAGWAFMEPNPWSPLYHLQILTTPAMSYREERGIWANDYDAALGAGRGVCQGDIGFFPPRPALRGIAGRHAGFCSALDRRRSPLSIYRVFGRRRQADAG